MKLSSFMKIFLAAAILAGLLWQPEVHAANPWPEGLKESAQAYIVAQQTEQDAIRESTLGELKGVIPMQAFDRESHNCHEVAGQSYRIYGKPRYAGKRPEGGQYVRVAFKVFYRQADRVREHAEVHLREFCVNQLRTAEQSRAFNATGAPPVCQ